MELDIGEIIKREFEKSGLSASQFARMINKERSLVYHIFKRQSIDTDLLYKISMALNIDLFRLFSEKLREENVVVEACSRRSENLSSKRKVMVEMEVEDDVYRKLITKFLEEKK